MNQETELKGIYQLISDLKMHMEEIKLLSAEQKREEAIYHLEDAVNCLWKEVHRMKRESKTSNA